MEQSRAAYKEDFIKKLSVYSLCIQPYLRNIQEKYVAAYYIVEGEKVDLSAYCKPEYNATISAKELLENQNI